MEFDSFPWLGSLHITPCFLFFSFAALFSLFSLLLLVLRLLQPWCSCDTCRTYLTASWASEFDNLCDWYAHLLRRSPTGTIHVHVLGNTITANPDNVHHILKSRFENYPKGKQFSAILGDLLGKGIFNADGDNWKFQRKMASLELGSLSVRSYAFEIAGSEIRTLLLPLFDSVIAKSLSRTPAGTRPLDLQDVFRRFSFDTICRFSFGLDPGCMNLSLPMSEFAVAFDAASKLSAERAMTASPLVWKVKRLLNLGSEKRLREAIELINVLADDVIKQRREMGFSAQNDLLSRFMGSIQDDQFLRDVVVSFLLAGRDTVASGLTGLFWLLSQNPKVEEAIRVEAAQVMDPTQDVATFEQIRTMHYLHAAVYESLRLFPPVQFDSKFALEDDVLPDRTYVRRGTRVTYHPYAMGRMERLWGPDCLKFKPERWLKGGVFSPQSLYKFPVFQAGPRVCLGKELAVVEMKTVALALIRKYNICAADSSWAPRFAPGLTATFRGGLPVVISARPLS
ncbi:cytochrome P450 94C1-like [Punica granatum]|uniref:Uncharacterized protein n=2 Tax=Punica granatum TaxID=22663 RepID=A0A218WM08_PUNGR|nr:cytochrome P450 94C1-like [Punica granatum]OWM73676.1 hypothetical protein CDL15_Pgr026776 [Punica granatum]PKI53663.1 hypothetical protein CRG98_025904 [Punica granatum]